MKLVLKYGKLLILISLLVVRMVTTLKSCGQKLVSWDVDIQLCYGIRHNPILLSVNTKNLVITLTRLSTCKVLNAVRVILLPVINLMMPFVGK